MFSFFFVAQCLGFSVVNCRTSTESIVNDF